MKKLIGLALASAGATASFSTLAASLPEIEVRHAVAVPVSIGSELTFTGNVRITSPFQATAPGRAGGATVSFDAQARTAWHTHPLGQTLIITAGIGLVQQEGQPAQILRPGDVVTIPASVRHWHGAGPGGAMTHVAIAEKENDTSVTWQDKVSDQDYQVAVKNAGLAPAKAESGPSRAQQLMGDVTPKLAELTDQVLFGDVWERPGLAKRDRSLATVSALIAMNKPDQLRSHLALGLQNGLTQQELSEVITHLAFYAGWPSAVSAAGVAKDVFQIQLAK